jgi:hypothetical protein
MSPQPNEQPRNWKWNARTRVVASFRSFGGGGGVASQSASVHPFSPIRDTDQHDTRTPRTHNFPPSPPRLRALLFRSLPVRRGSRSRGRAGWRRRWAARTCSSRSTPASSASSVRAAPSSLLVPRLIPPLRSAPARPEARVQSSWSIPDRAGAALPDALASPIAGGLLFGYLVPRNYFRIIRPRAAAAWVGVSMIGVLRMGPCVLRGGFNWPWFDCDLQIRTDLLMIAPVGFVLEILFAFAVLSHLWTDFSGTYNWFCGVQLVLASCDVLTV